MREKVRVHRSADLPELFTFFPGAIEIIIDRPGQSPACCHVCDHGIPVEPRQFVASFAVRVRNTFHAPKVWHLGIKNY